MLIRLLTDRAGGNGFMQREGEVHDIPEREAYRMLERGQAEAFETEPECAAIGPPETTHKRQPPIRRR